MSSEPAPPVSAILSANSGTRSVGLERTFLERLVVPWWWWLVGQALVGTMVVAVWAILSLWWALGCLLLLGGLLSWGFIRWSRAVVRVDHQLSAAGATISPDWLATVEVLDVEGFRLAIAAAASSGDHLVVRPWLTSGVRVVLADPADPHPSWIIGSRRPDELAAALDGLLTSQVPVHS